MKDPIKRKQHIIKDGLKFTLMLILITSATGIVIINCFPPENVVQHRNYIEDFDDQDSINSMESWDMEKEFE